MLLEKGRLTLDQFLELLRRQRKELASCPTCHAFYDLTGFADDGPFLCSECRVAVRPASSAKA